MSFDGYEGRWLGTNIDWWKDFGCDNSKELFTVQMQGGDESAIWKKIRECETGECSKDPARLCDIRSEY